MFFNFIDSLPPFRLTLGSLALAACFYAPVEQSQAEDEGEWSGYVGLETRLFAEEGAQGQSRTSYSLYAEPEFYTESESGDHLFVFKPFGRWDSEDSERTHADIREASWIWVGDSWELRTGVRKVFWGVAESQHLVDIINQTDLVENLDQEDKLGQPMINLSLVRDWGTLDLFALLGFRERTFPGEDGRFRPAVPVAQDDALYESGAQNKRVDFALRWNHYIGDWDIGVAHFSGTSREPLFTVQLIGGEPQLIPVYPVIDQTSVDVQATKGAWLWKLEAISRSGFGERYAAAVGGFEYTLFGVTEGGADLGLILEYQFDEREYAADGSKIANAAVFGARLALNDVQSSELLFGISRDPGSGAMFTNLEASRRLGDAWKLVVEARTFSNIDGDNPIDNPLVSVKDDDYLQLSLEYFF